MDSCIDCLKILTDEEKHYYGYRCEQCERFRHERIQRWRCGEPDKELEDEIFGVNHAETIQ